MPIDEEKLVRYVHFSLFMATKQYVEVTKVAGPKRVHVARSRWQA